MKIAIVTPFLHRSGGHGGITTWLLNVANEFVRRGHRVEVLVSAPRDRVPSHPRLGPEIRLISLGKGKLALYGGLFGYLRRARPDIVLSAGYRYNTAVALTLPYAGVPSRWVMTVRENLSLAVASLPGGRRWGRRLTLGRCLAVADRVIGVSADLARDMVAHWGLAPAKAGAIHNAIVDERIVARGLESVEHPYFHSGDPVLLAAGRLEPQKDYPTLLRALARLQTRRPARLIVLGEGSLRSELERLVSELGLDGRVDLAGFQENPFSFMRQADVFVLSSAWEGFGNVLAEAMAQGTPVVSTDCPSGPAEILGDGEFGPLVPVGDAEALAGAIQAVLERPLPAERLKQRAQSFSVQARVGDYLRLFEQLLAERDGS